MGAVLGALIKAAPTLPVIGIGITFLFLCFRYRKEKLLLHIAALIYGCIIIVAAIIFFPINKQIPAIQIISFSLIFVFQGFIWSQEVNSRSKGRITFMIGLLFLLAGIIVSCYLEGEYFWIPAIACIVIFASPFILCIIQLKRILISSK